MGAVAERTPLWLARDQPISRLPSLRCHRHRHEHAVLPERLLHPYDGLMDEQFAAKYHIRLLRGRMYVQNYLSDRRATP